MCVFCVCVGDWMGGWVGVGVCVCLYVHAYVNMCVSVHACVRVFLCGVCVCVCAFTHFYVTYLQDHLCAWYWSCNVTDGCQFVSKNINQLCYVVYTLILLCSYVFLFLRTYNLRNQL